MLDYREQDVLSAALKLLAYHPQIAWAMRNNTGGFYRWRGKRGWEISIRKPELAPGYPVQYVRFGVEGGSDIIAQAKDGRFGAIEIKKKGGYAETRAKRRLAQATFIRNVTSNNGFGGFAESLDDVQAIVEGKILLPEERFELT